MPSIHKYPILILAGVQFSSKTTHYSKDMGQSISENNAKSATLKISEDIICNLKSFPKKSDLRQW